MTPERVIVSSLSLPFLPSALAWSADVRYLAAGGSDGFFLGVGSPGLAVVEVASGAVLWRLDGWRCRDVAVAGPVVVASLDRGSEITIGGTASEYQTRLAGFDLRSGAQRWERPGLSGRFGDADPRGQWIAANTTDMCRLLDLDDGQDVTQVVARMRAIFRPRLDPTGRLLAVVTSDRLVLADPVTGVSRQEIPALGDAVTVAFDAAGGTVVGVDQAAMARAADCATGAVVSEVALEELGHIAFGAFGLPFGDRVALSPDGQLATVLTADTVGTYSTRTGRRLGTVPTGGRHIISSVFASPDGRAVVAVRTNSTVPPLDAKVLTTPRAELAWHQAETETTTAAFDRLGRVAVARRSPGAPGGRIDLISSGDIGTIEPSVETRLSALDVAMGGVRLVLGAYADEGGAQGAGGAVVRVFSVDTGRVVLERQHPGVLTALAFVSDGQSFVTGTTEGGVRLWNTVSGLKVWQVSHAGPVDAVAVVEPVGAVISAGADRTVRCIALDTGAVRWTTTLPQAATRLAVSPAGSFVATACTDRAVRLLDMADGHERWHVQHDQRVGSLAVSADSAWVASAGGEGIVNVVTASDGVLHGRVSHVRAATAVLFAPDDQHVVSGSEDGLVTLSPLDAAGPGVPIYRSAVSISGLVSAGRGSTIGIVTSGGRLTALSLDSDLPFELARLFHDDGLADVAIDSTAGVVATGATGGRIRVVSWPEP